MNDFHCNIWDENFNLLHPKSLRLFLIADMLCFLLAQTYEDDEKNNCKCFRCKKELTYSYYDSFLELIENCEVVSNNKTMIIEVRKALSDIKLRSQGIHDKFNRHDYPRAATSESLEMQEFFGCLAKEYIDSYEESVTDYIKLKDENSPRYTFTSIINLDGHKWEFSVPISNVAGDLKLSIDDKLIDRLESYHANRISLLFQILINVSIERYAEKIAADKIIDESDDKDELIGKSKSIASILGGGYQNYVAITSFTMMQRPKKISISAKEELIDFFMKEHRADISGIKEVVKIFLDKPMYH